MAVLLLPKTCAPALNVAAALTVRLLLPLLPSTALLFAVSNPATVRLVPYVTPALKIAAALTVNVLLLLVPSVLLPLAQGTSNNEGGGCCHGSIELCCSIDCE